MVALSERKMDVIRTLVESAPDRIVGGLQAALAETSAESALAGVRRLVDAEAGERRLRNAILQPLAPLCGRDGRASDALAFPPRILTLIWKGLVASEPEKLAEAREAFLELQADQPSPECFDDLLQAAAESMRARQPAEFRQAAEIADAAQPGGADLLASCLEIGQVVRVATLRLPEWLSRFDESSAAAARLAYKDAVAIAEDAGSRFFEMLAAQMAHPWMVLRVISEVMDKPTERYLADSEMAMFGERVLAEIDASLEAIYTLDPNGGPDRAKQVGKRVELVTQQINELETCVDLSRDHGWGARVAKQKQGLANVVEGRLRDAEKFAKEALPTQAARHSRVRKQVPKVDLPPDERLVNQALTLLTFAHEVRSSANYGGFASARGKLLESLSAYIDHYVEEVLDLIRTGDAGDEESAYAYLEICAQLNELVQGEKSAELVRRRAYALANPEPPMAAEA